MENHRQLGAAKIRLDDRGRLAVPNRLRQSFRGKDGFVLTAHPHGCLVIYTPERFQEVCAQIRERPNMSYFDGHLEELIIGCAEELSLDSADRFLISGHLRAHAGIARDVRLFGLHDSTRIWSEEQWEQKHALMIARLQDEEFSKTWQTLRL